MFLKLIFYLTLISILNATALSKCKDNQLKNLTLDKLNRVFSPCGALTKYSITKNEQIAYYLSTVSIESGNLTYNKNHFPGRPGQGTYSMLLSHNLFEFYKMEYKNQNNYNETNDSSKIQLLAYLNQNSLSFLPGAWWMAKGAALIQNPSCSSLLKDLVGSNDSKVTQLFTTCLGVDGKARIDAYKYTLNILKS
ncbi:hypothetical protein K502DRAFT_312578 [Neoconidiobolus thromboides FSU 785]|nr:hypothetical protein K502DRAFT_312578 [Neoconidiobolus thromboides FSU 785]